MQLVSVSWSAIYDNDRGRRCYACLTKIKPNRSVRFLSNIGNVVTSVSAKSQEMLGSGQTKRCLCQPIND